jgi:hypothetical protein
MIDVNSNCSRVDAVKAAATQLKLQSSASSLSSSSSTPTDGRPPAPSSADAARKVKSDLQTLDTQIKADDAQKAELALAVTKKDVAAAKTAGHQNNSPDDQPFRGLNAYA